jgi:hypothetical protein
MFDQGGVRTTFTAAEADEIRGLLDELPGARNAVQRMSLARLRRMGLSIAAPPNGLPTRRQFDDLVSSHSLSVDEAGVTLGATVRPHPSGRVFRVAVGVTGDSVDEDWNAFEERFQWFGQAPQQVASGDHLFVLAVDRWRSAVVGLYEAVSSGAVKLPGSPDPERWPYALGVRPLAAIPPPDAKRVDRQRGPQSGLPERVSDSGAQAQLYAALAESPPPPGPRTLEQSVQEVEPQDVVADVFEAVRSLGSEARRPAVIARAIEIGGWDERELEARAWYTATGANSHVENVLGKALDREVGLTRTLQQLHGVYSPTGTAPAVAFGVAYRPAGGDGAAEGEPPLHIADLAELDRATKRHMELQDRLADALRRRGVEPRSPGSWQPQFDVAFEHAGKCLVVEVKSGDPVSAQQIRLGTGQLLEYRHLLCDATSQEVHAVLLIEGEPPHPWLALAATFGIQVLRADQLDESLSALLTDTR